MARSRSLPLSGAVALVLTLGLVVAAPGYDGPVQKQTFEMPTYTTVGGRTIRNVRVGYTKDPNTVTTGPASIDPDTGKPYGMTFPIVTMRDFVNV